MSFSTAFLSNSNKPVIVMGNVQIYTKKILISEVLAWINILNCQFGISDITCSTVCLLSLLYCNLYLSSHPSLFPFRCGFRTDGQRNVGWSSSVPSVPGGMLSSEGRGGWGRWAADLTSLISLALGDTATMEVWEEKNPPRIHFSSPFIHTANCPSYTAQKHIFQATLKSQTLCLTLK